MTEDYEGGGELMAAPKTFGDRCRASQRLTGAGLSVRAANALAGAGISDIRETDTLSDSELLDIKNLGVRSALEIRTCRLRSFLAANSTSPSCGKSGVESVSPIQLETLCVLRRIRDDLHAVFPWLER